MVCRVRIVPVTQGIQIDIAQIQQPNNVTMKINTIGKEPSTRKEKSSTSVRFPFLIPIDEIRQLKLKRIAREQHGRQLVAEGVARAGAGI